MLHTFPGRHNSFRFELLSPGAFARHPRKLVSDRLCRQFPNWQTVRMSKAPVCLANWLRQTWTAVAERERRHPLRRSGATGCGGRLHPSESAVAAAALPAHSMWPAPIAMTQLASVASRLTGSHRVPGERCPCALAPDCKLGAVPRCAPKSRDHARGCAASYACLSRSVVTCVYTCVVTRCACPSSSCTLRKSAPASSRWVA